eukprot:1598486-Rhodomonas_salina.1
MPKSTHHRALYCKKTPETDLTPAAAAVAAAKNSRYGPERLNRTTRGSPTPFLRRQSPLLVPPLFLR